jgi:dephospho-CoA kinase
MLKVGITGGIGSGKSIVSKLFELLGVPVYNADHAAKLLMNNDPAIKEELVKYFGQETYSHGSLNRSYLASKVFNNPEKLKLLNSIVHPITINDADTWMNRQQHAPIVIKEAAIFFESGSNIDMDYMVGVYAPQSLRIQRVIARDNSNAEAIMDRMNSQMNEEEKMKRCDFIIYNDEQQLLIPQVLQLHKQLLGFNK